MTKEEIKERLDHIKENPGTLFGLVYPYILIIILGVGLYYLGNIGNVAQQNVPPNISETPVVGDLTVQQPKTIPPVDLQKIAESGTELLNKGKTIYVSTCSACHGEAGTGTGPGSVGLNPAPRNFTVKEGWKNGESLSGIYTSIHEGVPNSSMVAYDFYTAEEKFALAHYIRSEFISNAPPIGETELQTMDALYNLSAGTQKPGQIPTETSINIIAEEFSEKFDNINSAVEKITLDENPTGILLADVTDDLHLALSALSNSESWRSNENSFTEFLISNINQNGFNGKLFNLSEQQWSTLFSYCSGLL